MVTPGDHTTSVYFVAYFAVRPPYSVICIDCGQSTVQQGGDDALGIRLTTIYPPIFDLRTHAPIRLRAIDLIARAPPGTHRNISTRAPTSPAIIPKTSNACASKVAISLSPCCRKRPHLADLGIFARRMDPQPSVSIFKLLFRPIAYSTLFRLILFKIYSVRLHFPVDVRSFCLPFYRALCRFLRAFSHSVWTFLY